MTPTSPAQINLVPHTGQEFRSTPLPPSSQWRWEVQQSLAWPALEWRSTPAWGHNRPLLDALESPGLYNLFVPSLSTGIYNLEPPGNHRVRRWGELFTALGRASLASSSAPAGQERKGKAVYVCQGLRDWISEAMACTANTGLGWEGRICLLAPGEISSVNLRPAVELSSRFTGLSSAATGRPPFWLAHNTGSA